MSDEVKVFDWDDEIQDDGEERNYVTLEEGDYDFEVTKFERGHFTPQKKDSKTPACNQANITLKISTEEGDCFITERFPLASTMEWKISAFFRSVGLKQHGEKLQMKWSDALGLKGRAHVIKTAGTNENIYFNNIKYYIDPPAKEVDEWD